LAIACTILIAVFGAVSTMAPFAGKSVGIVQVMLEIGVTINLVLIAFNLIPIPPLDGSHVMKYLLPPSWSKRYQAFSRYGFLVLILLLYFGNGFLRWWMTPALLLNDALLASVTRFLDPSVAQWSQ
jgi:Zn-dependent protease